MNTSVLVVKFLPSIAKVLRALIFVILQNAIVRRLAIVCVALCGVHLDLRSPSYRMVMLSKHSMY